VLGCGIDRDYPAAHRELAARIRATGLTVSEYAPGVEPAPWRFPARKRRGLGAVPVWLSYAVVPAAQGAECCARVAWVRPGNCCPSRQGTSEPNILSQRPGRPSLDRDLARARDDRLDLTCAECGRSPRAGETWRILFAVGGEACRGSRRASILVSAIHSSKARCRRGISLHRTG
jgi:hypothetical protein